MRSSHWFLSFFALAVCRGETLELTNGKQVEVRLVQPGDAGAEVEFQGAKRMVPWAEIKFIHWPQPPEEQAALEAVKQGAPLVRVMDYWTAKKAWLGRPNSNAGVFALAYAAELAKRRLAEERKRARELFLEVETGDWDPIRRETALLGRWEMDLADGKGKSAAKEILGLPETSSARLAVEGRLLLAKSDMAALDALQAEHPKWQEEEEIIPQRQALFQRVVDNLLYPILFHGAEEARCRASYELLAAFYGKHGEKTKAEATKREMARLYPAAAHGTEPAAAASE
jgi:hypothetical protein